MHCAASAMRALVWQGSGSLELRSRWDLPGEGAERYALHDAHRVAAQVLRACQADALRALLGPSRRGELTLHARLTEALRRGEVVLWRRRGRSHRGVELEQVGGHDELLHDVRAQKTWIEIELLDMEGNPMPGEPYRLKLPDGTERRGTLDAQGRAYFGNLDPGQAEIFWEARDGDATENAPPLGQSPTRGAAPTSASPLSRHERTWVELELLDMDDAPVPYERYWIKLPDGTVREGALNAQGRAYFDDLDLGTCEIRWPFRDGDATGVDPDPTVGGPARPDAESAVSAQVAALIDAARVGVPFCAECEAARQREAAESARARS